MSTSRTLLRAVALLAAVVVATPAHAQTWTTTAPAITASAKVNGVQQFSSTKVNLDFGSNGIIPGDPTAVVVAPWAADAAAGTGAKFDIRFNTGTKVTVSVPTDLVYAGDATIKLPITFSCATADDRSGTNSSAFTCATGAEWLNAAVKGMTTKSVGIGATIDPTQATTLPSGIYSGSITVALANSSS